MKSDEKPEAQLVRSKKFKWDKKFRQGFIAGCLSAALVLTGLSAAINPEFLTGTFSRQIGDKTLDKEVDLEQVDADPASIPAQTTYDQTFLLDIAKDKIASFDKKNYQLSGQFRNMEVKEVAWSDANQALALTLQGDIATSHAYGSDMTNEKGQIFIMPDALADNGTAYQAEISIDYPRLTPETGLLEITDNFDDVLNFTLEGDTFARTLEAADIQLTGGIEDMAVTSVQTSGQQLSIGLKGPAGSTYGNGVITLSGSALSSGWSVDQIIRIAGAGSVLAYSDLTTQTKTNDQIDIALENDFFKDTPTPDMFTLGGALQGFVVSDVKLEYPDAGMASITITGGALLKPGIGTITVNQSGVKTGRELTGSLFVVDPTITVSLAQSHQAENSDVLLYDVFSVGDDFSSDISAEDVVLKGGLSGMSVQSVNWLNGYHIEVAASGTPGENDGIISIRSKAMGGVTGAESSVAIVEDLGILDATAVSSDDFAAQQQAYWTENAQTGGFVDSILDWGLDKVKGLIIEGIKAGLKTGAEKGLEYALRSTGIIGPSVDDQLKSIDVDLQQISKQMDEMEQHLMAEIQASSVQQTLNSLNSYISYIDNAYIYYKKASDAIVKFRTVHGDNADPYADPVVKSKLADFVANVDQGTLKNAIENIGTTMAGVNVSGQTRQGYTPLIKSFYQMLKNTLPFEHNSLIAMQQFVSQMTLNQAKGQLIYAEFCNYLQTMPDSHVAGNQIDLLSDLETFNDDIFTTLIDAQIRVLGTLSPFTRAQAMYTADTRGAKVRSDPTHAYTLEDLLNLNNVWGAVNSGDIIFTSNRNDKTYVMVGDTFKVSQLVVHGSSPLGDYYVSGRDQGILKNIIINRGGPDIPYDIITSDDADAIFKGWSGTPYEFLLNNVGDNSPGPIPAGTISVASWLWLNRSQTQTPLGFLGYTDNLSIYNWYHGNVEPYTADVLYNHTPDVVCKVILVHR